MNCTCVDTLNARLKATHGLKLASRNFTMTWPECTMAWIIATEKADGSKSRKSLPPVFASHCPFCGKETKRPEKEPGDSTTTVTPTK